MLEELDVRHHGVGDGTVIAAKGKHVFSLNNTINKQN
jgi:hypothetical protein